MDKVWFSEPTVQNLEFLSEGLRESDVKEIRCVFPTGPLQAVLQWSVDNSVETLVAHNGCRPVALFGCGVTEQGGVPWMLATNELETLKTTTLRSVKTVIDAWLDHYGYLYNDVHKDNKKSQAMVRWLGFTIDPEPSDFHPDFHRFWKRKEH